MTTTLTTKHRTITLTVTELPDRITLNFSADRIGAFDDDAEITEWGRSILSKWDNDPRPFEFRHPLTGDIAIAFGDANQHTTVIFQGPKS